MCRLFTRRAVLISTLALGLLLGFLFASGIDSTILTCLKCKRYIRDGMTLQEVEMQLGPGVIESPPGNDWSGPVVRGEECYRWCRGDVEIYIAFRDGRVCDRYWSVDLLP
jgi:hypothetical protein